MTSNNNKQVFISYHWNDQPIALKLHQDLKKRGYSVWIDVEQPQEQVQAEEEAPAFSHFVLKNLKDVLLNSFVIVALISPGYNNSLNCRRELELAKELQATRENVNLHLIPVILDKNFKVSPWLQVYLNGASLYEPEDYSGIAKKIWSFADVIKSISSDCASSKNEQEIVPVTDLVNWVTSQSTLNDEDKVAYDWLSILCDNLADESARKSHAKELVGTFGRLLASTPGKNPRSTKLVICSLSHFALDHSQASTLRPLLTESFHGNLDKIIALGSTSEAWESCASAARDLKFLFSTGSLDSGKKKVLISYSWDGKVLAYKMAEFFKQHAPNWSVIDTESITGGGSNMEKAAALVASATAVLVVVTPGYETSTECKSELLAAKRWNKTTIFAFPDGDYHGGSSWLKFAMGEDAKYEFSDSDQFSSKMSGLIRNDLVPLENGTSARRLAQQSGTVSGSGGGGGEVVPGRQCRRPNVVMSTDGAREWLESIGIPETSPIVTRFLEEEIDGDCLRGMATMSVVDLQTFLDVRRRGEILRLKAGLDDLILA